MYIIIRIVFDLLHEFSQFKCDLLKWSVKQKSAKGIFVRLRQLK